MGGTRVRELDSSAIGEFVNREIKPSFRFEIEQGRRRFRPE